MAQAPRDILAALASGEDLHGRTPVYLLRAAFPSGLLLGAGDRSGVGY